MIKKHWPSLLFSLLHIFFSAPGQTFLISICVGSMFTELGVSISVFAGLYSISTIVASLFLRPLGKLIDTLSIQRLVVINTVMMALGCAVIAVAHSIWMLFIGFVIIRLYGQGLFLLTSSTSIGKHFKKNRGKALSVMTLGFSLSELIYPALTLLSMFYVGWRGTYILFSVSNIIIVLPILYVVSMYSGFNKKSYFDDEVDDSIVTRDLQNFTFKEAFRDKYYYMLITASCVPPVVLTGLLFHQETIFNLQSWSLSLIPLGYSIYAIFKIVGTLGVGPFLDRYGPAPFFVLLIILLGLGSLVISIKGDSSHLFVYFALVGAGLGMSAPVMNVVWPNMYGTEHLGEIKGFVGMFRNGLTALGPLPLAIAIDYGINILSVIFYTSLFVMAFSFIPFYVHKRVDRMNG